MLGVGVPVVAGLLSLAAAVASLSMTARDLALLAVYIGGVSLAGMVLGWLSLATLDRLFRPRLAVQVLAATLVGTAAALANVWIVASLMFVNTAHDLRLLIALLLGGAVVTTFFAVTAASMTGRRLDTITEAIARLVALDYTPPAAFDGRGGGEVARLAQDVDRLRVRLAEIGAEREALDSDRRYFTAAISHDLRTPVATVRALVDALDDGVVETPGDVADYYGRIRHETQRLARMIDDLSELAQIDAGALRLDLSEVPLQEVAAEVVEAMRPLADQCAVTLSLRTVGSPPPVSVDAARMERALANLLRNALEHTEAGGTVEVRAAEEGGCVLVAVADTGHGISEEDLGRIWDRFYRAERSRHRSPLGGDGSGLGLAIVRGIVEAHGGSVAVSGEPGGGACFEVRVPLGERF